MSGQQKQTKPGGGWGSFLSGAVAGLESRLDNILAEDDQSTARSRSLAAAKLEASMKAKQQNKGDADSRASSRTRANDRLQERLAKAMNKGNDSSLRPGSRAGASDKPTPSPSPALSPATVPRLSSESRGSDALSTPDASAPQEEPSTEPQTEELLVEQPEASAEQPQPSDSAVSTATIPTLELPSNASPRPSQDSTRSRPSLEAALPSATAEPEPAPSITPLRRSASTLEAELERMAKEREEEDRQRREEMVTHLERIDALQAKLKALTKSAEEAAKQAKEDTGASSVERRLAEKDQAIVDLMREAEARSKEAFQYSETLKKVRVQNAQRDKGDAELKRKCERLERGWGEEKEGRKRAEAKIKDAEEKVKIVARIEKDVDELKREKEQNMELIRDLRRQLGDAIFRAEDVEKRAKEDQLEQERRAVADLKEELENLKIEKKLAEDRARSEMTDLKAVTTRKEERSKMTEVELRSEVMNLETKLELLRSRTEEASSSVIGDSQAKLLRQIETLQTQYSLASENWQGIESTLNARVVALEKERDDISKREADVRKKAREVNSKSRRLEEELEIVQERTRTLEQDMAEHTTQVTKLQARASQADTALSTAREQFERDGKVREAEFQQKLEEERTKWRLEFSAAQASMEPPFLRNDSSPIVSHTGRKASHQDLHNLNHIGMSHSARRSPSSRPLSSSADMITSSPNPNIAAAGAERPVSRRISVFPYSASNSLQSPGIHSPVRQLSATSLNQMNGTSFLGPSIDAIADDETGFEPPPTGASSPQHRGSTAGLGTPVADIMSASTVNAGPSVQLVERMSAAVRRLESEKASLKEEMSRLSGQRDEARSEVVRMMREADEEKSKGVEGKLQSAEKDLGELREKWERALEMLGERQEECEELKHDVVDLKGIIRGMAEERAQK